MVYLLVLLRATNQPLRPEAGAADGCLVADAVFQVGVRDVAAAAEGAGREGKALHALAVGDILRVVPQIEQAALAHIPHDVAVGEVRLVVEEAAVRVQQRPARADIAVPAHAQRAGLDVVAHVVGAAPAGAGQADLAYARHQYQLTSYYDNTSDHDVDSMAVMYMYLRDKKFVKPDLSAYVPPVPAPAPADGAERTQKM